MLLAFLILSVFVTITKRIGMSEIPTPLWEYVMNVIFIKAEACNFLINPQTKNNYRSSNIVFRSIEALKAYWSS